MGESRNPGTGRYTLRASAPWGNRANLHPSLLHPGVRDTSRGVPGTVPASTTPLYFRKHWIISFAVGCNLGLSVRTFDRSPSSSVALFHTNIAAINIIVSG